MGKDERIQEERWQIPKYELQLVEGVGGRVLQLIVEAKPEKNLDYVDPDSDKRSWAICEITRRAVNLAPGPEDPDDDFMKSIET